jgi:hypothetical protein
MRRAVEAGELTEVRENTDHEARIDQQRHEPMPASHHVGHDQSAADGNEGRPAARPGRHAAAGQGDAVRAVDRSERPAGGGQGDAVRAVARPERPTGGGQGDAVRAMKGGPPPQGDVPDAPATQIAGADSENGQVTRVSRVANAVPGKPDGEVDTRS